MNSLEMSNLITDPSQINPTNTEVDENIVIRQPAASEPPTHPAENEDEDEIVLKYGAGHVVKLFIPVTICLLFVILSLSFVTSYQESGGATL